MELFWIGKRIGQIRMYKQYTQGHLGSVAGMSQSEISKMEKGKRDPGFTATLKMLRYMKVKISSVVTDDGEKAEDPL